MLLLGTHDLPFTYRFILVLEKNFFIFDGFSDSLRDIECVIHSIHPVEVPECLHLFIPWVLLSDDGLELGQRIDSLNRKLHDRIFGFKKFLELVPHLVLITVADHFVV